jgi:ABC-2 type transport system ATP-binding protein
MTAALEIVKLSKTYRLPAVDELSLTIPTGGIYALLGPNGAGKTTTLRMVTGLVKPDSGAISVLGINALADPINAQRLMAGLPDEWSGLGCFGRRI